MKISLRKGEKNVDIDDILIKTINKSVDDNFNVNHQFISYVVEELNQADLGITNEQGQHLINVLEYVSKQSAQSGAIAAIKALIEAGLISD